MPKGIRKPSLPTNWVNEIYERLDGEFSKSYISKVGNQVRSNDKIMAEIKKLAEEYRQKKLQLKLDYELINSSI